MSQTKFVMPERRKLGEAEISQQLENFDGWTVEEGKLHKKFTFDSYKAGLVFATAVGHHADRIDHHPDLFIGYQHVVIDLNTHDVGGISTYDFALASIIETLV